MKNAHDIKIIMESWTLNDNARYASKSFPEQRCGLFGKHSIGESFNLKGQGKDH